MRIIRFAVPVLSSLLFATVASASKTSAVSADAPPIRRLSTGVIAPRLIKTTPVRLPWSLPPASADEKVVLNLDLSRGGRARDLKVVASDDPLLNNSVVAAVQHFRWHAARLDHRAIPVPVHLTVMVSHVTRYD